MWHSIILSPLIYSSQSFTWPSEKEYFCSVFYWAFTQPFMHFFIKPQFLFSGSGVPILGSCVFPPSLRTGEAMPPPQTKHRLRAWEGQGFSPHSEKALAHQDGSLPMAAQHLGCPSGLRDQMSSPHCHSWGGRWGDLVVKSFNTWKCGRTIYLRPCRGRLRRFCLMAPRMQILPPIMHLKENKSSVIRFSSHLSFLEEVISTTF